MATTRVSCPNCQASLRIAADAAAKVRCPECETVFRAGDDEPPARRSSAITAPKSAPASRRRAEEEEPPSRKGVRSSRSPEPPPRSLRRPADDDDEDDEETGGSGKKLVLFGGIGAGLVGVLVLVLVLVLGKKDDAKPTPVADNSGSSKPDDSKDKGNPDEGNPNQGNPDQGNPNPGNPDQGNPNPGNPNPGNPNPGNPNPLPRRDGLDPEVLDRVKRATVYIRVRGTHGEQSSGTGFFGINGSYVVTNAHVIGMLEPGSLPPRSVEVVLNSGEPDEWTVRALVVSVDQTSDLAVLSATGPPKGKSWPQPLTVQAAATLRETQKVYVVGYPFGEQLGKNVTVSDTSVSSLRKNKSGALERVQVNGGMHQGNSGGPVINEVGEVVGVAVAIIRGTSINFAIPGEHVQSTVRGRLSASTIRDPVMVGGKISVPVELTFLDPMKSIRDIGVDWWIGGAGSQRPPAESEPSPQAGDSPRVNVPATSYNNVTGSAALSLSLDAMPPAGKVLWFQPRYVDASGRTRWASALGHRLAIPIEPEPLTLTRTPRTGRTLLDMQSMMKFNFRSSDGSHAMNRNLVARFHEDVRKVESDGSVLTYVAVADKFEMGVSVDDRPLPPSPRLGRMIQDVGTLGLLLRTDSRTHRTEPEVDLRRVPAPSRDFLSSLADQIGDSFDLSVIPYPAGEVKPGQRWDARKMVPIPLIDEEVSGPATISYTYQGVRTVGGSKVGIITLKGDLEGFRSREVEIGGVISGEGVYDPGSKRITVLRLTTQVMMRLRFLDESVSGQGTLEVKLSRGPEQPLPSNLPTLDVTGPVAGGGIPRPVPLPGPRPGPGGIGGGPRPGPGGIGGVPGPVTPPPANALNFPVTEIAKLTGHQGTCLLTGFSPDGRYFAAATSDSVYVWDGKSGAISAQFKVSPEQSPQDLMFSGDGRYLIVAGTSPDALGARVYEVQSGKMVSEFTGHDKKVSAAWLSADARTAISAGADGFVRVWDARTGKETSAIDAGVGPLSELAVSSDGRRAAAAGSGVAVLDLEKGRIIRSLVQQFTNLMVPVEGGKNVLSGSRTGVLTLWDMESGKIVRTMRQRRSIDSLNVSSDGKYALATSGDGVYLWDLKTGRYVYRFAIPVRVGETQMTASGTVMSVAPPDSAEIFLYQVPRP